MDVAVIGSGPSGSYAAYCLAKAGFSVTVFEEHEQAGLPVHCTGLCTKELWSLVPREDSVIKNVCERVSIRLPSGTSLDIPLTEYVLDRARFDQWLVERAVAAGARVEYGSVFVGMKEGRPLIRRKGDLVTVPASHLVGADGPNSAVAKSVGLFNERRFYIALQARVRKGWDRRVFDVWFGSKAPEFFAWSVPESSDVSRVGLAARRVPKPLFDTLLKEVGGEIMDYQAGPLPVYNGLPCSQGNVALVGDAGTLSKATTGGGIITGMISGKIFASALSKGRSYERELRPLRRELWLHYWLRRALNTFDDVEYERLVRRMASPRVRRILSEYPREFPSRFVLRLLAAQPGFLLHSKKFIKTLRGGL